MNPYRFMRFLPDARAAQGRSKDRSTRVGGVAIDNDLNIRGSAYNGFARGIDDNVDARHQRPAKYKWTAHCEENLVAQAARVGVSLKGCTLLLTSLHPCTTCSRMLIQAGIVRVLAPAKKEAGAGAARHDWDEEERIAAEMLREAGVEVIFYEEQA